MASIVGPRKALYYFGTSTKILPEEAMQSGLVDEIFDQSTSMEQTEYALRFLHPFIKQEYKSVVNDIKFVIGQSHDHDKMMELEREMFKKSWQSPDNKNAVSGFLTHKTK